ncbi:MAG: S-layer homology domain-containing protein [Clostridia bacterium]|nr:S-layer homology domain-containing protein [Clostridia bacterium]
MKKYVIFLLVILMFISAFPVSVAAGDTSMHLFTADRFADEKLGFKSRTLAFELVKENGMSYYHGTVSSGIYLDSWVNLSFSPAEFSLTEYKYVKLGYRSNSKSTSLDVSSESSVGESWVNEHPKVNGSGIWTEELICIDDIKGGGGNIPENEIGARLIFKPFGAATKNTDYNYDLYFDIEYVAFFKDKSAAQAYDGLSDAAKNADAPVDKTTEQIVAELPEDAPSSYAYSAYELYENDLIKSASGIKIAVGNDDDGSVYLNATSVPGTYNNGQLYIRITPTDFSLTHYNYVKLGFRTDTPSPIIDVSSVSSVGESWFNKHPSIPAIGEWTEMIIDLDDLKGGGGNIPAGEMEANLHLKPFGSGNVTLESDTHFDIKYIAFFASEADAKAYEFKEEDVEKFDESAVDGFFYELADREVINGYLAQAEALKQEIINSPTSVTVTGTKYYVSSSSGDDSNDGKTPESAWKTIEKVNSVKLKAGDGIFFKRGDKWKENRTLQVYSGISVSAYGEGAKPMIVGTISADSHDDWIETEFADIYKYKSNIDFDSHDVGTIIFDGGRAWGIQVQRRDNGIRMDNGTVYNGIETYTIPVKEFVGPQSLEGNLEFWHDRFTDNLYLRCEGGNPAEVFASIELCDDGKGIELRSDATGYAHDIIIDNIAMYGVSYGVSAGNVRNVTVQNCTFEWIGGPVQSWNLFGRDYGTRYGNAVESYGSCDGFTIKYCYGTNVYDCCWTVQDAADAVFKDLSIHHNVTEFSNNGLELWGGNGSTIENVQMHDNYTLYSGYGWSHQRPNKDASFFYGGANTYSKDNIRNTAVYNNVNLFSSSQALFVSATAPHQLNFHDNVYIMENGKKLGGTTAVPGKGIGQISDIMYTEEKLKLAYASGFEKGGKFYYTEPEPLGNMYELSKPDNGVKSFTDISENFWGREAIDYVALKGLFQGVSADTFAPDAKMTRAMLVTVLSRLSNSSELAKTSFTDVVAGAWYENAVAWAEKNEIVTKGTSFRPDDNATREELADMLYRYAFSRYKKTDIMDAKQFADSADVSPEYADAVKFCSANGIIGGYTDGTIKPKNTATRAEVATMIKRFAAYLANAETDVERAVKNSASCILTGDELVYATDMNMLKKTVREDKNAQYVPFSSTGAPYVRVLDSMADKLDYSDFSCVVIKYSGKLSGDDIRVSFDIAGEGMGVSASVDRDSQIIVIDYSKVFEKISRDAYQNDLEIKISPWGGSSTELDHSDVFVLESVAFFENIYAGENYAAGL